VNTGAPRSSRIVTFVLLSVLLLAFAPRAFAYSSGQAATLVLGQPSFISNATVASPTQEDLPSGIAFDSGENIWVADTNNNRVIEYKAPFSTHETASLVVGQTSLNGSAAATSPTGLNGPTAVAFDPSGNLWVVDNLNSRVLEYKAPFSTGEAATTVIGQSGYESSDYSDVNSTGLSYPVGLDFDSSGNLWVADQGSDRVLEYMAPLTTHEAATLVIGQADFKTDNFATSPTGLNGVNALAFDSKGNLWVVDFRQSRVLEYTTPFSTHEAATLAIGQTTFTSRECAYTTSCAANSTNLFDPDGLSFDSGGNLWVSDGDNNRVLEYQAPFSMHERASVVIGQSSLTGNESATTAAGLSTPQGLAFDSSHNLWVADYSNSRVLQYGGGAAVTTTTATTPEFPALAVPIIFIAALAAALVLAPARKLQQP